MLKLLILCTALLANGCATKTVIVAPKPAQAHHAQHAHPHCHKYQQLCHKHPHGSRHH